MADSTFLYLFRGGADPTRSPEEMQRNMQKWTTWVEVLAKEGHLQGGQPLEFGGKVLTGKSKPVTDGPFAEAKDVVGGYLLVTARDINQATELARGCPVFDDGGTVEVRGVRSMTP